MWDARVGPSDSWTVDTFPGIRAGSISSSCEMEELHGHAVEVNYLQFR